MLCVPGVLSCPALSSLVQPHQSDFPYGVDFVVYFIFCINKALLPPVIEFKALSSLHQQGTDVRWFSLEFSDTAEGLGFNDAALKDLFNSALDEPLS